MTDQEEMLALANDYESGLKRALASGYEEFGSTWERRQRLIIAVLRASAVPQALAAAPAVGGEPVAWLHQITEPDGKSSKMHTSSSNNPWSLWVHRHRDKCTYTATPLYAAPPASPLRGREDAAALVNRFERESMALHQTQREWLVREIGKAIASPPEQPAAAPDKETENG